VTVPAVPKRTIRIVSTRRTVPSTLKGGTGRDRARDPGRLIIRLPEPTPRRELLAADPRCRDRLLVVATAVVAVLTAQPGISLRRLRIGVRAALGSCSDPDTDAAVELLGDSVSFSDGPRGAWRLTIDPSRVPAEVAACLKQREPTL
jgi:hypothetical protein